MVPMDITSPSVLWSPEAPLLRAFFAAGARVQARSLRVAVLLSRPTWFEHFPQGTWYTRITHKEPTT